MVPAAGMIGPADTDAEARRADALYREKARAEVAAADALVPGAEKLRGQGDLLADVLLVKGIPGPGDVAAGRALAGEDGRSIGKALDALELSEARFALCTRVGASGTDRVERLRMLTEAIDPRIVILLDREAATDFAEAYRVPPLALGEVIGVLGRKVLAVDGFEAALGNEQRKRLVWSQLRALKRV